MNKKHNFYKNIAIIATFVAFFVWGGAAALGILDKFEYKIYDVLLGMRKSPAESQEILLVDIDDTALNSMGAWPWPRDIMADQMLTMRELGAKTAVFDIEFISESQKSIDEQLLNEIIENPQKSDEIKNVLKDNDDYFARSLQFFGNSWLTINTGNLGVNYTQENLDYTKKRFLYQVQDNRKDKEINSYENYSPAAMQFISRAKGAGFTNVVVDEDGSRRRIKLFTNYQDGSLGQLAVAPLLQILEPEQIIRNKKNVILKNAKLPGSEQRKDIKIPLDNKGNMLIHWLKKPFATIDENGNTVADQTSFQHYSVYYLWSLNNAEKQIIQGLKAIQAAADPESIAGSACSELLFDYQNITDYKNYLLDLCTGYDINGNPVDGENTEDYQQYFDLRAAFFQNVLALVESGYFDEFEVINDLAYAVDYYTAYFEALQPVFNGKVCLIGNAGSSTTDLGTTPFANFYPNVGTHANIFNTIVQQDFIIPVEWYWSVLIAALFTLLVLQLCQKAKIWLQNAAGIFLILVMIGIPSLAMVLWGIYIPVIASVLLAVTAFIIATITKYVSSEKDKSFLQSTFGAYVAPAVVDQIVKNPDIAKLGGKSDNLTALFSDVKTFSRFTEIVNNENGEEHGAEKLVACLNGYLGALSDAIMENNGTIDKYVGDEIVSFFGAPIHSDTNAYDACVAAIRMREAEDKYNKEHASELPINPATGEPYYLHSRIGLNTGNMVVGNMGTEKKLNYTIMGNNVNLASRLEGTNNAYGSWIMCSETTWNQADSGENKGKIVARKFDYVRVINVRKPVGIYNIIGLKDELPQERIAATEAFNKGMAWYLKGISTPEVKKDPEDLKTAIKYYKEAEELYPDDGSSKVFIERCELFLKEGLPELWDGIYTMKSK